MADINVHYDPISVVSGPVTVDVQGLDNTKNTITLETPQPLKSETTIGLAVTQPIETDSKFEFSTPQPLRAESKAELDVKPLAIDLAEILARGGVRVDHEAQRCGHRLAGLQHGSQGGSNLGQQTPPVARGKGPNGRTSDDDRSVASIGQRQVDTQRAWRPHDLDRRVLAMHELEAHGGNHEQLLSAEANAQTVRNRYEGIVRPLRPRGGTDLAPNAFARLRSPLSSMYGSPSMWGSLRRIADQHLRLPGEAQADELDAEESQTNLLMYRKADARRR
jgi:hypothetical protein